MFRESNLDGFGQNDAKIGQRTDTICGRYFDVLSRVVPWSIFCLYVVLSVFLYCFVRVPHSYSLVIL